MFNIELLGHACEKKKKKNMQKDIGDVASPPVYACDCFLILCPL